MPAGHRLVLYYLPQDLGQNPKMLARWNDLARGAKIKVEAIKLDFNNAADKAMMEKYKVPTTPAMLLFKNGEVKRITDQTLEGLSKIASGL